MIKEHLLHVLYSPWEKNKTEGQKVLKNTLLDD